MAKRTIRHLIDRHKKMKTDKQSWLALYQICAEYVMSRKQGFTTSVSPGTIQTDQIYDDTAPYANTLMAAAIIGAIWPNGAKSFRITAPHGLEEEQGGVFEAEKKFYESATKRMASYLDHPRSGLQTALEEYMLDQGAFGISGTIWEEQDDPSVPLTFRALDAKSLYIAEGKNGFIDTVHIEMEFTLRQLVQVYGLENLSTKRRDAFMKGENPEDKITVLHIIEPRLDVDPFKYGNEAMPIASIHIDIDMEKKLKQSGYKYMPCQITRFWKAMGEVYGRCPAMNAMPSIFEANALAEAWTLAVEKTLDPSLLVMDDGAMGNGVIDTSPGGITVVSVSGRISSSTVPIQPLFLVGDLQWTAARRTELAEVIKNHFYQDRLMDLNNEHRMQNPEVAIRNELRGQTLNTVYNRQFSEQLVPLIEGAFNSLLYRGYLGVIRGSDLELAMLERGILPTYIPDSIVRRMESGQEVFRIEFISPAVRIMQSEEKQGINELLTTALTAAQANPDVLDVVDWDWTLRRVQELGGAPRETIISVDRLAKMRADKRAMQQAQMDIEARRAESETARNMGQAASSVGLANSA